LTIPIDGVALEPEVVSTSQSAKNLSGKRNNQQRKHPQLFQMSHIVQMQIAAEIREFLMGIMPKT